MRRTELPSEPWQHHAIDFYGPLPSGDHLFVVVDYFSRFVEVEIMKKIDSSSTIQRLKTIFARFGLPISITSDNGPQFISQEFQNYCEINNIILHHTIPFWPQQNGEVERQNRSLLKRMTISQNTGRNWKEDLHEYLLMYRSTPHSVTLKSPAELMFSRPIRDKLPTMNRSIEKDEELVDRDKEQKGKMKDIVDKKRRASEIHIKEGDLVLLKRQHLNNKLQSTYSPNVFKVIERIGSEIIVESATTSSRYRRNVAHAKLVPPVAACKEMNPVNGPTKQKPSDALHDLNPNSTILQDNQPSSSKRSRRAPVRLNDYV